MAESIIQKKSFNFAVEIVNLSKYLRDKNKEFVISNQLLKSGTSIGANIKEALYAQSKKDFVHKANIALKEAGETEYWIELLIATNYLDNDKGSNILNKCIEVKKVIHSIVKTTKKQLEIV